MITPFEVVQRVYDILDVAVITNAISGDIYKFKRLANSKGEDLVINTITANNDQLEQGIININVHAPNITVGVSGVQDTNQPNTTRLKAITDLVVGLVDENWFADGHISLQQISQPIEDEAAKDHYINIRLEFFFENIKS